MMYYVYLLLDAEGRCLYVGCTTDPSGRLRSHTSRPWGDQIASLNITLYRTRSEALEAELEAIKSLNPPHNIHGTVDAGSRRLPKGALEQLVLEAIHSGATTQLEVERWLRDNRYHGEPTGAGGTISRLINKGSVRVTGTRRSLTGRWPTAREFEAAS